MKTSVQNDNKMAEVMHKMMQEMNNASLHGDPDNHFARMMQLHHSGVLNMGNLVLEHNGDPAMTEMVKTIMQKQKEEIAALQLFLNNNRPMPHTEHAGFNTEMKKVMDKMDLLAEQESLTGDPDQDFAMLMVHHHQAAIEMASLVIVHGADADIKKLAGMIKTDKEAEIQWLQKWLNERRGIH
ncbi:DUF305 domain-containing protein [Pseudoflavitalea rhizosphaerae]|uniref:DUF305 domain-containing protein n=1 Tax=Pseudoflavitalea rhizosphaerae TaxID=1884793 RepID=UPI0013DE91E3|nr:DUF305 domain-containing protein [Pseudoflavitalea rhizosphaerae]